MLSAIHVTLVAQPDLLNHCMEHQSAQQPYQEIKSQQSHHYHQTSSYQGEGGRGREVNLLI